nr:MAG TPA: hypothetical protein [Caudoviricetes sp.]
MALSQCLFLCTICTKISCVIWSIFVYLVYLLLVYYRVLYNHQRKTKNIHPRTLIREKERE